MGAGLAGLQTVVALRDQGFTGPVTVLGAEGVPPYDRPPLSKHLLDRTQPVWLADDLGHDLAELADDVRWAEPARSLVVGPGSATVRTGAATYTADAVVLACGARAVLPPRWDALTLHTAADAQVLRERLTPGARLVCVGAGWIGAEVAGVAAAAGLEVTVVEAGPTPLGVPLGEVGARTVPWYRAAGVRLVTGTAAAEVRRDEVVLADGRRFDADVVLAAVGVRPATDWLAGAVPVAADGALEVDAGHRLIMGPGRAGPHHVRAVGDCARRLSPRHGWVPGGHWDGALRGPAVAVRALLDGARTQGAPAGPDLRDGLADVDPRDDPAPYVFSTQLGHELAMFGQREPGDEVLLRRQADGEGWTALWFRPGSGTLTAALAVDWPRDAAGARRLFTGPALPVLDRARATDGASPLRAAVVG